MLFPILNQIPGENLKRADNSFQIRLLVSPELCYSRCENPLNFCCENFLEVANSETPPPAARSRKITMNNKSAKDFEYLANDPEYVPDPEIEEFMEGEISRAPKDPEHLAHRLRDNTAASPRDSGGDLDASWEDVNDSGSESVAGHNPTPDQSDVEENAHAIGVSYEDNEELEFIDKIERRDRERFELDQRSKASEESI
jgi:uncharacterized protein DUF6335